MAYPSTTILPPSPSRISDPVNFVNESALYLQNLPNFRTQFNALTAYINTKYPNYNNYGTVVDSNPVMPTVATFATGVSGTGVAYISSLDTFYENLYTNSSRANSYGAWIDSVMTITGTGSTDVTRAQVPAISAAATRSQTRTAFNTSSILFTETAIKSVRELASAFNYINTNAFSAFDNGLVTAAIDATDDYGRFKATYLDGTKNLDGTYTLSVTQTTNDIVLQDSVTSLFAGGLEGVAYDFNDLSTLFQDHEGRTPVTAATQPIGLVLDKSKGLALGTELVTNGAFTSNITGWTSYEVTRGTVSYNSTDKRLKVDNTTGTGDTYVWTSTAVTAGLVYKISGNIYDIKGDSTQVKLYWWNGTTFLGAVVNAPVFNNAFSVTLRAPTGATGIMIGSNNNTTVLGGIWEIDNISVKQITGNHAIQVTPASRPTLQRNTSSGSFYASFDGTDDFLVTNSIDFTVTDKISLFAGVRKLTDSTFGVIAEHGTDTDVYGSFAVISSTGKGYYLQCGAVGNRTLLLSSGGISVPRSDVVASKMDRAKTDISEMLYSINGQIMTSNLVTIDGQGATGNFANQPLYIGRRGGTTYPFNGHIYALVIVGKLASDGEIYEAEKILADRVGILV